MFNFAGKIVVDDLVYRALFRCRDKTILMRRLMLTHRMAKQWRVTTDPVEIKVCKENPDQLILALEKIDEKYKATDFKVASLTTVEEIKRNNYDFKNSFGGKNEI